MKFWLNANLSPKFAHWLSTEFHIDCKAVKELGLRDAKDGEIFLKAKLANAILITKDADFVDLVLRHGAPPQIVLLTSGNTSNAELKIMFSRSFLKIIGLLESGEPLVEFGP